MLLLLTGLLLRAAVGLRQSSRSVAHGRAQSVAMESDVISVDGDSQATTATVPVAIQFPDSDAGR